MDFASAVYSGWNMSTPSSLPSDVGISNNWGKFSSPTYPTSSSAFWQPNRYNNELAYAINKDNQLFNTNSATIAFERQQELDERNYGFTSMQNLLNRNWQERQNALDREWQTTANQKAMAFTRQERIAAEKYATEMSNTAIQRQVADLKKSGLNPILAATTLGGASSPSGAMGTGYSNGAGTSGISSIGSSRSGVNSARSNSLSASSVYHIGDLARAVMNTAGDISRSASFSKSKG